jgi:hypothetical protein
VEGERGLEGDGEIEMETEREGWMETEREGWHVHRKVYACIITYDGF